MSSVNVKVELEVAVKSEAQYEYAYVDDLGKTSITAHAGRLPDGRIAVWTYDDLGNPDVEVFDANAYESLEDAAYTVARRNAKDLAVPGGFIEDNAKLARKAESYAGLTAGLSFSSAVQKAADALAILDTESDS